MSIMLKDEWKEVVEALKTSKSCAVKNFGERIEGWFPFDKKLENLFCFGTWKTTICFQNKNTKRVDVRNKPIECVEMLNFSKGKDEKRISFAHLITGEAVKYVTDKALFLKETEQGNFCKLVEYKGNETKTFTFQIKNNKVIRFKEEKGLEK